MTQRMLSDAAQLAVLASGTSEPILSSLERDGGVFVLTPDTLIYQDEGGVRRVTLRDLTRIHSDQDGVLRVETPAGTALAASLIGFDPKGVQNFFSEVRDTTARSRAMALESQQPAPQAQAQPDFRSPDFRSSAAGNLASVASVASNSLYGYGAEYPEDTPEPAPIFSAQPAVIQPNVAPVYTQSYPTQPAIAQPATTPPPRASNGFNTFEDVNAGPVRPSSADWSETVSPSINLPSINLPSVNTVPTTFAPTTSVPTTSVPTITQPSPAISPIITPNLPTVRQVTPAAYSPEYPTEEARAIPLSEATVRARSVQGQSVQGQPVQMPPVAQPQPIQPQPVPTQSTTQLTQSPERSKAQARAAATTSSALLNQASTVAGLVNRLRFLGGVLFAAALALAVFQFMDGEQLTALWTLLAGGVGTITLLAMADMAALLVVIAQNMGHQDGNY